MDNKMIIKSFIKKKKKWCAAPSLAKGLYTSLPYNLFKYESKKKECSSLPFNSVLCHNVFAKS